MAIPNLPNWIGIILCFAVLALTAISVIKATAAGDAVSGIDKKIESKTSFIKALSSDAENLISSAKTPELKTEAKKVFEAIRYSDPMSNSVLEEINEQIQNRFFNFAEAVESEDLNLASASSDELLILIDNRNKKCKLLKK